MGVPWKRKTEPLFPPDNIRGNKHESHATYNNAKWRNASKRYFKGKKCIKEGCISMASCTDHIIPIRIGGSQWDRRNWQPLCTKHHQKKSAAEGRGKYGEFVETETGRIPKDRAHLEPDIVGQSYLTK